MESSSSKLIIKSPIAGETLEYGGETYKTHVSEYECDIKIAPNKTEKCAFYNDKEKCRNIPCGSCIDYANGIQLAFRKV